MNVLPLVLVGLISAGLTGWVRRYALRSHLLDTPNQRSSHSVPTPRGGGLAIAIAFLLALLYLLLSDQLDKSIFLALAGGGVLIAGIGYWDDRYNLSAKIRLLGHFSAAVWAVSWIGGIQSLDLGFAVWKWGWLGYIVSLLGIVWLLNLYNFMDGIDGLAASEAIFAASIGGLLLLNAGADGLAQTSLSLAAACAGFLCWNWPPAKIFMGDVGSGFLGYTLAVLLLASDRQTSVSLWAWLLLLSVFAVDATITLLRRLLRGEKVSEAHRSHAYQHATIIYGSHLKVMLATVAINLIWLAPLTIAAWRWTQWAVLFTVLGIFPLLLLVLRFQAGIEQPPQKPASPEQTNNITTAFQ